MVQLQNLVQEVKELQQNATGDSVAKYSFGELIHIKENLIIEVQRKQATLSELIAQKHVSGVTYTQEQVDQFETGLAEAIKAWKFRRDLVTHTLIAGRNHSDPSATVCWIPLRSH